MLNSSQNTSSTPYLPFMRDVTSGKLHDQVSICKMAIVSTL